jgi:hypothetical protein
VLYPAELRARRVVAIAFGAFWQGGAGVVSGGSCLIRPVLTRGAKPLPKSKTEKSEDEYDADVADDFGRKHV